MHQKCNNYIKLSLTFCQSLLPSSKRLSAQVILHLVCYMNYCNTVQHWQQLLTHFEQMFCQPISDGLFPMCRKRSWQHGWSHTQQNPQKLLPTTKSQSCKQNFSKKKTRPRLFAL